MYAIRSYYVKEKVAERLNLPINSPAIVAMEWLGLFSDDLVKINEGSTFDLTTSYNFV